MKDKKLTAARVILTVLTIAAIAAIFYNSSLDADTSTEQSSPLTDWFNGIFMRLPIPFCVTENFVRKAAHFTEYSILGAMLSVTYYLYFRKKSKVFIASLCSGAIIASVDELIQLVPAGRSAQVSDVLLDCCSVIVGTLIVLAIISIIELKRRKKKD